MSDVAEASAEAYDAEVDTEVASTADLEAEAQAEHESLVNRVEKARAELAGAEAALAAVGG